MEKKPDFSESMLHLIASLVTTYQMEVEDWDLGPMTTKNWRKINHQVIEHNESLKVLCIGLKAAYESIKINLKEKDREISSLQSQNERLLSALKDEMSPRVAKLLLKIRDEITKWDASEAYHALYEIVSPKFDKTEPWENIERIAKAENNEETKLHQPES